MLCMPLFTAKASATYEPHIVYDDLEWRLFKFWMLCQFYKYIAVVTAETVKRAGTCEMEIIRNAFSVIK